MLAHLNENCLYGRLGVCGIPCSSAIGFITVALVFGRRLGDVTSLDVFIAFSIGYIYAVLHSNITKLDKYCGLSPQVCNMSHLGLPTPSTS